MPRKKTNPDLTIDEQIDQRPDPKPRKHPQLWQSYLLWDELMRMRQRHNLRISSVDRGKSQLDAQLERDFIEHLGLDDNLEKARKLMINYGKGTGDIWEWLTSIKGLGAGGEAAKLLAQIDDISKFDTPSKLWRFAGFAVMDGKAEKNIAGEVSHYNRKLKAICYMIADQFIRQQTPAYVDIYYAEKEHQRQLYPDIYCKQCSDERYHKQRTRAELNEVVAYDLLNESGMEKETITEQKGCYLVKWEDCPSKKKHMSMLTDAHIHNRAWRKMVKQLLLDVWVKWRTIEGLPVTTPFAKMVV